MIRARRVLPLAVMLVLPLACADDEPFVVERPTGADDVVHDDVSVEELAWRVRMLLRRKSVSDRLRHRVQSRLHAAMTDPLTGLFNRRYALPQLERMGEQARATGRSARGTSSAWLAWPESWRPSGWIS